uniref:ribosomal protein L29 n=1 Tax=Sahlingia subintegra TaxID=468936 RepID=UPI001FCE2DBF|nr:ribosomal protein L29 [Sahlingia subintegra]UNJ17335.1 ribosomal protein L29 [Sahlingia subintegra]
MVKSAIKEYRSLSLEEIEEKIIETKKEIFSLRLKKATKQLEQTHLFKYNKHILCQLITVEAELKQ